MTQHSPRTRLASFLIPATERTPEAVCYGAGVWWFIVLVEIMRHLVESLAAVARPQELATRVLQSLTEEQTAQLRALGDGALTAIMIVYYGLVFVVAVTIMCLLAWMVRRLVKGGKNTSGSRRLLMFFAIYFALRGGMVLVSPNDVVPQDTTLAIADGAALVAIGVAAVLALIYLGKKESVAWARPESSDSDEPHSPTPRR